MKLINVNMFLMLICLLLLWCCSESDDGFTGEILFTSTSDGNEEIYRMNADGSELLRLTNNSVYDREPAWSPDGSKILFISDREDSQSDIYIMNADGSEQARLTYTEVGEMDPSFSPDGNKILFIASRNGKLRICTMDVDGSNETILTATDTNDYIYARYSPDGTQIAYTLQAYPVFKIGILSANGFIRHNLTNDSFGNFAPVFSPDGSRIAFHSNRAGGRHIFTMNTDGSNITQITHHAELAEEYPDWSPDGRKIVYTTTDFYTVPYDLNVANADGSNAVNISNSTSNEYKPRWRK
ncbi:MAG: PD40 domain-containing protein [Bacteroidales bacterium]|nr:PD40 domain-containing protein [Bacteroidales bacterium]